MPTVTLNRKTFEDLVGKKLPEDQLKDRISMLGTDLDAVTTEAIVVEIFPNRPDMLSEQGFARAFSSFIGHKTGLREYDIKKSGYKVIVDKSVSMRPYTACAIVKNLKFTDEKIRELMQIQEKLATTHGRNRMKSAYGIYPADKIDFPITYIAKEPSKVKFQPLGFDKEMVAKEVEKVHPKGQAYKQVAKGWKKYPFFIDAKDNVLCMLPYTNSHDTGKVELDTTDVFIECTGTEFDNIMIALNILITTLSDMGGEVYSLDIEYPDKMVTTPDLTPSSMTLDLNYVNKRLGLNLNEKDVASLLSRMGHDWKSGKVLTPAWRDDIMHPLDLVEDVAIAYGYENFTPTIPQVATIGKEAPVEIFQKKVVELLVGMGLIECNTYHIVNEGTQQKMMNSEIPVVKLANALNEDYTVVRAWMLPCLMDVLSKNKHHSYPQNIFDLGVVFKKSKEHETGVNEFVRLGVAFAHETADYTQSRQCLEYLFKSFGLEGEFRETESDTFIPGRVARVSVDGVDVAYCGEMDPSVLSNFDLQVPVSGFELNLTELFKLVQ